MVVCFGSLWLYVGVGGRLGQPGGGSGWLTGGWWGVGLGCPGTVGWVGWGGYRSLLGLCVWACQCLAFPLRIGGGGRD